MERIKKLVATKGLFTNQEKIGTQKWLKKIKKILYAWVRFWLRATMCLGFLCPGIFSIIEGTEYKCIWSKCAYESGLKHLCWELVLCCIFRINFDLLVMNALGPLLPSTSVGLDTGYSWQSTTVAESLFYRVFHSPGRVFRSGDIFHGARLSGFSVFANLWRASGFCSLTR